MSLYRPISVIGKTGNRSHKVRNFKSLGVGIILGGAFGFWAGLLWQEKSHHQSMNASPGTLQPPATPNPTTQQTQRLEIEEQPQHTTEWPDLKHINLEISGSLYATLATKLYGRELDVLTAQLGRILVWWIDLQRDVQKGDRLQALYRPVSDPSEFLLLAVGYTSSDNSITKKAYGFRPRNAPYYRYYDSEGKEIELRLEQSPIIEYEQITALMDLTGRKHHGIDFKTNLGTPVMVPYTSQILRANWSTKRNGNCLELRYLDSGIRAIFLHLDDVLPIAKPGRTVDKGTIVAHTGNTGHSTAPHLHYQLHSKTGQLLNPFKIHPTKRLSLDKKDLDQFRIDQARLESMLVNGIPTGESVPMPSSSNVSKGTPK